MFRGNVSILRGGLHVRDCAVWKELDTQGTYRMIPLT